MIEQNAMVTPPSIEDVPLIPRDALFGNPERTAVQLSPDGRHLSWLAPRDGVLNVWVAPADDPDRARPVTHDAARGIRAYFWSYLADTLVYLRDTGGDEDFHVLRTDVATGDHRDLTPYEKTAAQIDGVSHRHPGSILVAMNDRDPQWHDLYRVDLATGERTLLEENTAGFAGYLADAEYVVRYAFRMRPDGGMDVLTRRGEDWEVSDDIPFEDALTTSPLALTADGTILYVRDSRGRNTSGLFAVDTASGGRTLVHDDSRADVGGILSHPVTGRAQAVSVNYLRDEWTAVDEDIAADLAVLAGLGPGEAVVNTRTLDDSSWVVAYSAGEAPLVYYRYDRAAGSLTKLFSGRPALDGAPLVPMKPVEIPARDTQTLVSYLTVPAHVTLDADNRADVATPMVLLVHGGPWARDEYGFDGWAQWLANRGYAVLQTNFRGSTGFGKDFTNIGDGQWGAAMHDDLIDAVEWAVQHGIATADRVAIMGGSYGGYATLAGLSFTPDTFTCGVDIVGPSNLNTLLATIPPYWASYFEQLAKRVGDPRTPEGQALLTARSPLTHVERIARPLLIGQGANDPRVKQAESDQIVEAMTAGEIPVTYVLFPDEGHGFARPENSKAFNAVAEGFLAQFLGGRSEQIGDDLIGSSITVPAGAGGVPGLAEALASHEPTLRS